MKEPNSSKMIYKIARFGQSKLKIPHNIDKFESK